MNKSYLLAEYIQAIGYGKETFHQTIATLSNTLSLYLEATAKQGYVSTKGGTAHAH